MNKQFILLLLYLFFGCMVLPAKEVRITLKNPGTLADFLKDESDITELILSGEMNSSDFYAISQNENLLRTLTKIDLYNVSASIIPKDAFYACDKLVEIILPNALTVIESDAFTDCTQLKKIQLPLSIRQLGAYCFSNCQSLVEISIPEGVVQVPRRAFDYCCSLKEISLPSTLKAINNGAFYFTGLSSIDLPQRLEIIEEDAFYGSKLEKIMLPASLREIGINAFINCPELESISVADNNTHFTSLDGVLFNADITTLLCYPAGKQGKFYEVPPTTTSLGDFAFSGAMDNNNYPINSHLTSIKLPDGLKSIAQGAFSGRIALKQLDLPNSINEIGNTAFFSTGLERITIPEQVKVLSDLLFYNCLFLKKVNLPDNLQTIGEYAFYKCPELESIQIPSHTTKIGYNAFNGCSKLKEVVIPDRIHTIYGGTFYDCTSLVQVHLPVTLHTLESAFSNCSKLNTITIPASLNYFDLWTFNECDNLQTIYLLPETPPVTDDYDHIALPENVVIYVPDGSVDIYKSNPQWGIFDIRPLSTSGLKEIESNLENDFNIQVNSEGEITIRTSQEGRIEIYSLNGLLLHQQKIDRGENHLQKTVEGVNRILIVYTSASEKRSVYKL